MTTKRKPSRRTSLGRGVGAKARAIAAIEIEGLTRAATAELIGVCPRTIGYWLRQYRDGQLEGMAEFLADYRRRAVDRWLRSGKLTDGA